jgi:ABC-type thiamine transport system substrate-binding protein
MLHSIKPSIEPELSQEAAASVKTGIKIYPHCAKKTINSEFLFAERAAQITRAAATTVQKNRKSWIRLRDFSEHLLPLVFKYELA